MRFTDIEGIPVVESAFVPAGTAVLLVKNKGVITKMVEVYNELQGLSDADLFAEIEKRRPCSKCIYKSTKCSLCGAQCKWNIAADDMFKVVEK